MKILDGMDIDDHFHNFQKHISIHIYYNIMCNMYRKKLLFQTFIHNDVFCSLYWGTVFKIVEQHQQGCKQSGYVIFWVSDPISYCNTENYCKCLVFLLQKHDVDSYAKPKLTSIIVCGNRLQRIAVDILSTTPSYQQCYCNSTQSHWISRYLVLAVTLLYFTKGNEPGGGDHQSKSRYQEQDHKISTQAHFGTE